MFSVIVVIILGLAIGLPLGLLLNKSSASSGSNGSSGSSGSMYRKPGMGWHKNTITGEVIDIENTFYQGKSLAYYADNNLEGCSWGYDKDRFPNYIELIIPTTSKNENMLKRLGKIIKDPNSTNYYSPDYYVKDHYYVNFLSISPYRDPYIDGESRNNPVYNGENGYGYGYSFIYGPLPPKTT